MDNDKYLKGTTTVGVVCTDGIVLASEQRATMGNFIASKTAKKVYQIDDRVAMTIAGSVGDAPACEARKCRVTALQNAQE